ncbi:MAG TPA: DUF4403 family protein [Thermoanaerobaculia bacterium]|nr:DUF4403 family protein [Thermoanaerobaculia bacterium]
MKSRTALLALLVTVSCSPPPPPLTATTRMNAEVAPVAAPAVEVSTFVVPIRANLTMLTKEVEARVPKTFKETVNERGFDITYNVTRDPVRLQMIGAGLHASTVARYSLEVCRGRVCISCGVNEPKRQAAITLHSAITWDPSWRLASTTKPLPLDFPTRCAPFGFDVTERFIAPIVRDQLAVAAKTIDKNTPAVTNLRATAQEVWSSLQTPMSIGARTWLVLEPQDVAIAPLRGSGLNVASALTLHARTRVVIGEKPVVAQRPLPALTVAAPSAGGVRVPFDLELSYPDATRLASDEFAGRSFDMKGQKLTVRDLHVAPGSNGKLLVDANIDYRSYHGIVRFEGAPVFDAATSSVTVPDLDYALTRGGFIKFADHFAHDTLRARLRENARFPIGTRLTTLRNDISRALTRPLAPGVALRAQANAIQPVSVTAASDAIVVRVIATGTAEVDVK